MSLEKDYEKHKSITQNPMGLLAYTEVWEHNRKVKAKSKLPKIQKSVRSTRVPDEKGQLDCSKCFKTQSKDVFYFTKTTNIYDYCCKYCRQEYAAKKKLLKESKWN